MAKGKTISTTLDYFCANWLTQQHIMFARLHPLLVHIPIGCIFIAAIAPWFLSDRKVLRFVWLLAFGSAVISCITGYLLSTAHDGYDAASIQRHQYLNIAITFLCCVIWWLYNSRLSNKRLAQWGLLPAILTLAGTFTGATLTHGSDFLTPKTTPDETAQENGFMPSNDLPPQEVAAADPTALAAARKTGLMIMPIATESHWLSVNAVNAPMFSDQDLALLTPIADQIVWLRLSDTKISDQGLASITPMRHLTRLYLDHTQVTGTGLNALQGLQYLSLLSLSGTPINLSGLENLPALPALKKVFLYKTAVGGQDISGLKTRLNKVNLDTGGYAIPLLEGDTSKLKAKASY